MPILAGSYMPRFKIVLIVALIAPAASSFSQVTVGRNFIKNFQPKAYFEYSSSPQNLDISQDQQGVVYIANPSGLLVFDGKSIALVNATEGSNVYAVEKGSDGIMYVGMKGDLGFVGPERDEGYRYYSLLDKIPLTQRGFAEVRKIHSIGSNVFFTTDQKVFRWNGVEMKVFTAKTSFWFSYALDDRFFVWQSKTGLMELNNDGIVQVSGREKFKQIHITSILPYDGQHALLTTWNKGLFLWDGDTVERFRTEADSILMTTTTYQAINLDQGRLALATLGQGVLLLSTAGKLLSSVSVKTGLADNNVMGLFYDRSGGLWCALDKGFSRVEVSSPITYYGADDGLDGIAVSSLFFQGRLYAATSRGLYIADQNSASANFQRITGLIKANCIIKFDNSLLVGGQNLGRETRIFAINGQAEYKALPTDNETVNYLIRSEADANRVYVGSGIGVYSIYHDKGNWINEPYINGSHGDVRTLAEDHELGLWVSYKNKTLCRFQVPDNRLLSPKIDSVGVGNGLPDDYQTTFLLKLNGELVVLANNRVFHLCVGKDKDSYLHFEPHPSLDHVASSRKPAVRALLQPADDDVWMANERNFGPVRDVNDTVMWEAGLSNRVPATTIWSLANGEEGEVWCASSDGLIRINPALKYEGMASFRALIRRVVIGGDSSIYRADGREANDINPAKIAYDRNSISISYSATAFDDYENNLFSVYLAGNDKKWSDWDRSAFKEYTNLPEGVYEFHVKAKNVYGLVCGAERFGFVIATPFYRSWWFYGIQIGFLAMLFGVSYRFGRSGGQLARLAPILATVAIVILFEYFQNYIEDNFEHLIGGITFLKVMMNVLLVFLLLPLEGMLKKAMDYKSLRKMK